MTKITGVNWRKEWRQSKNLKLIIIGAAITLVLVLFIFYFWQSKISEAEIVANNTNNMINPLPQFVAEAKEVLEPTKPWYPIRNALYLPGRMIFDEGILDSWRKVGGNTVVIDVKTSEGKIMYKSQLPLVQEIEARYPVLGDLKQLVTNLHSKGFMVVARQVCFQDDILAWKKLDWAIVNKSTGKPDRNIGWVDASVQEVQDYNLAIAKEVAEAGVDEIQFDYIRFPVDNMSSWKLHFDPAKISKTQVIADFLKQAKEMLKDYEVKLAADVFGIIAWEDQSAKDLGQDPYLMAESLDVIYPMVYPSHFHSGFEGHKSPANEPYYFVQESVKRLQEKLKDRKDKIEITPWLQGFALGVRNFNSDYITKQLNAIYDIGVYNYSFWHGGKVDTIIKGVGESKAVDKETARELGYQLGS